MDSNASTCFTCASLRTSSEYLSAKYQAKLANLSRSALPMPDGLKSSAPASISFQMRERGISDTPTLQPLRRISSSAKSLSIPVPLPALYSSPCSCGASVNGREQSGRSAAVAAGIAAGSTGEQQGDSGILRIQSLSGGQRVCCGDKAKALPIKRELLFGPGAGLGAQCLQCRIAYRIDRLSAVDPDVFRRGGIAAGGHLRVEADQYFVCS